ncbi:Protein phosphatase PP2A regulatory subunit B [Coemansia javaensis]|uniref:Polyadenylate-binding protein n=1 Tax=Coemansia javaensis TaxID=2761396 RepID=A0A9W8LI63_9FUNG|nr:Protein phosphatase PP2A regulatory subunit B [Coemansia javaensis]
MSEAASPAPAPAASPAAEAPAVSAAPAGVAQPAEQAADAPAPAAAAAVAAAGGAPVVSMPEPAGSIAPMPNASLYVGELDPSVTESVLFELFSMVGPVASIRVCRDTITRRSLGYAYVNYHNRADGERALETLNYTEIKDRPCRIMWSQRNPEMRRRGTGNVFIKNLDPTIDNKALHDTFAAFGNILSCKVVTDANGNSCGYGYVHYDTREAADLAIQKVNGMLLNDMKVYVGHHIPREERESNMEKMKANFTNVYVKHLDPEVDDAELETMFAKFGEITSVSVQRDEDGASRKFAFVNFKDHESARRAVEEMHDSEHRGQQLYVARAQKRSERERELRDQYERAKLEKLSKYQGVNLYIKNFDEDITEDRLRQEFVPYGVITSVKIMVDDKGDSRGFGFVCFSTPEEANKAVAEMNGRMLGKKPLYVAVAQRSEQRRQHIEAAKRQWHNPAAAMGAPMYAGAPMYYPPGYAPPRGGFQQAPRPVRWQGGQPLPGQYPVPGQYAPVPGQYPAPAGPRPMRPRNPRQNSGRGGGYAQRGGRGAGGYRNNPRAMQQAPAQPLDALADAPAAADADAPLPPVPTPSDLAAAPAEEQKQMLGEALYPRVLQLAGAGAKIDEERAGKITGMLLEMDNSELLNLFEEKAALSAKVAEALEVLADKGSSSPADDEQKQSLGEALYARIVELDDAKIGEERAGKITGMLLEMDVSELTALLEDTAALSAKVAEALDVLAKDAN